MLDYQNLTRIQAIELFGAAKVDEVDAVNCECTNGRDHNGDAEFAASVEIDDDENDFSLLRAIYYQDWDDAQETEDLSDLTWVVHHYEAI